MPRFMGENLHTVDDKGRVFIPSKFRDGLGEKFVLSKGFHDRCLYVLPNEVFESIEEKFAGTSMFDPSITKVRREFYSSSSEGSLDKQGRVVLPQNLRDYAEIKRDVIINGAGTWIEIWDKETYEISQDPNGMASALRTMQAQGKSI